MGSLIPESYGNVTIKGLYVVHIKPYMLLINQLEPDFHGIKSVVFLTVYRHFCDTERDLMDQ